MNQIFLINCRVLLVLGGAEGKLQHPTKKRYAYYCFGGAEGKLQHPTKISLCLPLFERRQTNFGGDDGS